MEWTEVGKARYRSKEKHSAHVIGEFTLFFTITISFQASKALMPIPPFSMSAARFPPAPPSSPAMMRPNVVVFPPEEDQEEPFCCYDPDDPVDHDSNILADALHRLPPSHNTAEFLLDDLDIDILVDNDPADDSEIYQVIRVSRHHSCSPASPLSSSELPQQKRSTTSFFKAVKALIRPKAQPVLPPPLRVRQSNSSLYNKFPHPDDEEKEDVDLRAPSPSPTTRSYMTRHFSMLKIFSSSSPSLPSMSRTSDSSSSSSSGPDTPVDTEPMKITSIFSLHRFPSFRREKSSAKSRVKESVLVPQIYQPPPAPSPMLDADTSIEMQLDSLHFDDLSFDPSRF
ncbi:uncharacterized protein BT62DRAFT_925288 [Guyanagaster necrorhizus]|uniref:Uncharacterized protein n=1 Tax=Guyanagaster necrorhizus TaxID=856835 RepID=A0A9P7W3I5_9AGAR|nr:uncharacterized protein BT62DRAFT_925288 [Guyanagaster necrorhizus MCA 3950]KAG7452746.1 hypothetical protein BT62DRAFT_925288 [Guyanagaster necrorhizus MCA 3950]